MAFCPKCRSEYVDAVTVCTECGVALVDVLPSKTIDPSVELVQVYRAQGELDAQVVRSLLEANAIDCMLSGESVRLTHGLTVDGLAEVKILVRAEDAERARDVISSSDYSVECPHCGEFNPAGVSRCRHCGRPVDIP